MVRKLEPTFIIEEAERAHERNKRKVGFSTPAMRDAYFDQLLREAITEQNEIAKNTRRVKHAKAISNWKKVTQWIQKLTGRTSPG